MREDLEFASRLAEKAGNLLKEYFRSDTLQVGFKSDHSLVTAADLAADALIGEELRAHYPDDLLLSEETSPALRADQDIENKSLWVVDPLDGSTNFNLGLQYWGISLARLEHGFPSLAVIHFPLLDETYSAVRGEGAWLNGATLRIQPQKFHKIAYFACCARTHKSYQVEIPYKTRILGSAAYTYCAVARSAAIIGFEVTPKIWDLAGAWLIVEQAGGSLATIDGETPFPVRSGLDYSQRCYPTLASYDPQRLAWARERIQPKPTKM